MHEYYRIPNKRDIKNDEDLNNNADTMAYVRASAKSTANLQLLANILKSVHLGEADYILFDEDSTPQASLAIQVHQPSRLLLFGLSPQEVGLQLRHQMYLPIEFNSLTLICAHELQELQQDAAAKRALWQGLQKMYLS